MHLYLVQHADAKSKEEDPERHLTLKGRKDVEKMASFVKPLQYPLDRIWHSGKARAKETAEILAAATVVKGDVSEREGLGAKDTVKPLVKDILKNKQDTMIVGHLPFMSKLVSTLIAGEEDREIVAFQKGGVVCLQRHEGERFVLRWMITPDILP